MICDCLNKYNQGKMNETDFRKHADSCSTCQEALYLDEHVMSMAKSLRQHIEAPYLWNRIEESLVEEMAEKQRLGEKVRAKKSPWRLLGYSPALLVLILAGWFGIHFFKENRTQSSGLMAQKALAQVEKKEQDYLKAIQDLEKQALPRMADMDLELVFLYRDRLETIDAQIKQCQEAMATNPANAHIRRYLMMALHDKKETLVEILNPENEKVKSRRSI